MIRLSLLIARCGSIPHRLLGEQSHALRQMGISTRTCLSAGVVVFAVILLSMASFPNNEKGCIPMIDFENTIVIQRPVEEVFAFVANFENVPKWNYYVMSVRQRSEGAIGEGTIYTPDPEG